jgi:hypothetical protein
MYSRFHQILIFVFIAVTNHKFKKRRFNTCIGQKRDTEISRRWFIIRNRGKPLHRCTAEQIKRVELTMDTTEGDRSFSGILQSPGTASHSHRVQALLTSGGSFRRTLKSAIPAQRSSRTGPRQST